VSEAAEVVICAPQGWTYRAVLRCRKCKRRTRHLVTTYVWYDPTAHCLAHERPTWTYPDWQEAWQDALTRQEALIAVVDAAMEEIGANTPQGEEGEGKSE
jgi:hypothetical protein